MSIVSDGGPESGAGEQNADVEFKDPRMLDSWISGVGQNDSNIWVGMESSGEQEVSGYPLRQRRLSDSDGICGAGEQIFRSAGIGLVSVVRCGACGL